MSAQPLNNASVKTKQNDSRCCELSFLSSSTCSIQKGQPGPNRPSSILFASNQTPKRRTTAVGSFLDDPKEFPAPPSSEVEKSKRICAKTRRTGVTLNDRGRAVALADACRSESCSESLHQTATKARARYPFSTFTQGVGASEDRRSHRSR